MRGAVVHRFLRERTPKPLAVRAGLGRTFGSLAAFLALLFLSLGIYLLGDAFAHPVDAGAAAVIVAAFAIALAAMLFFYLFKPRRLGKWGPRPSVEDLHLGGDEAFPSSAADASKQDLRKGIIYQHAHVNRSRIRP